MHIEVITNAKTGKVTERVMTATEIASLAPTPDQIRNQRNQLLTASDWTQVADAPVDQAAWATYRQALRDIPQQEGFPTDIAWPIKP